MKIVAKEGMESKDKLFNFRPALFAAIFLIFGILFAYFYLLRGVSTAWLWLFLPVGILPLCFCRSLEEIFQRITALLLLISCFALGFIGFRSQVYGYQDCVLLSGEVIVCATVENKTEGEESALLLLSELSVDGKAVKGRLNAYLPRPFADETRIADRVVLRGELGTDNEVFAEYGFKSGDIFKDRYYTLSADELAVVGRSGNLFLCLRARMEKVLYAGMDETPAALTLALLTGDTSGIDAGLWANMRYGGISHIFAVSGLNVGALFLFCLFLFHKTPLRRTPKAVRFFLLVGLLFFYAGVCGFTASVVRAAIMCAVGYFYRLLGTGSDLLSGMGVAAFGILFFFPTQLFDVGFQLSFLACLGLVLLTKPIGQVFDEGYQALRRRFPKRYTEEEREILANGDTLPVGIGESLRKSVVTLLSASLAAQIMTLPALLIHFGYVSGWSLLLNFIFVPFTDGIFTILLVLTGIACLLPTAFSGVLLYLPSVVWSAATLVFEVADFSSFALSGVKISAAICLSYYGGLSFLSDKWNVTRRMKIFLALLLLGSCFVGVIAYNA